MEDQHFDLPIRYYEASAMVASFSASTKKLRALTPDALRLVEMWPGRTPVSVACFDHARTSIGPYGEVVISWPVVEARSQPPPVVPLLLEDRWPGFGHWVHHAHVSTDAARQVGEGLFGVAETVAAVEYSWEESRRTCRLSEDGAEILSVGLETRLSAFPRKFRARAFSARDGELLSTRVEVDAVGLRKLSRTHAWLSLGAHGRGRELAELDVDLTHPIEMRWYPVWRATVPGPERRGRAGLAPIAAA